MGGLKERVTKTQYPSNSVSLDNGHTWITTPGGFFPDGKQKTVSESHRMNPKTRKYESGGPFSTVRSHISFPTMGVYAESNGGLERAKFSVGTPMFGPESGGHRNVSFPWTDIKSVSDSSLNSLGATAIAQSQPLNQWANTGTALGEIVKDGLPHLPGVSSWQERTRIAKAAGSEYLNTVFGWLPLVKDVKDTFQSTRQFRNRTNQFRSQAGTNVHRRFDFPITRTRVEQTIGEGFHASTELAGGIPFPYAIDSANLGTLTRSISNETRTWFEGCFTYGIPAGTDMFSSTDRVGTYADKLFGLELTPTLMWELTPWSWAVDWFSNAGDVVSNFTALKNQGLVMRYGYMMSESTEVITYSMDKSGIKGFTSPPPPSTVTRTSKSRVEANPYGFGVSWQGLSPFQLAVTAALGITRLR